MLESEIKNSLFTLGELCVVWGYFVSCSDSPALPPLCPQAKVAPALPWSQTRATAPAQPLWRNPLQQTGQQSFQPTSSSINSFFNHCSTPAPRKESGEFKAGRCSKSWAAPPRQCKSAPLSPFWRSFWNRGRLNEFSATQSLESCSRDSQLYFTRQIAQWECRTLSSSCCLGRAPLDLFNFQALWFQSAVWSQTCTQSKTEGGVDVLPLHSSAQTWLVLPPASSTPQPTFPGIAQSSWLTFLPGTLVMHDE